MTNFHTLFPSSSIVGFDQLFKELDSLSRRSVDNYPPHNVLRISENRYAIELAVAGFSEEDITIEVKENELTVFGEKSKSDDQSSEKVEFIHQGISKKKFKKNFRLSEHVQVKDADLKDGILTISLEYVLPEEIKPKKIPIGRGVTHTSPRFLSEGNL